MMLHLKEQGFERVQLFQDEDTFHKRCMGQVFARSAVKLFGMNENEAVAMVGRTETRVPEAIDALLHGEPERKKAVFAINTHTLFLVLRELEHRKVRIPDDLGVCGYDALGWSELVYPGISSIYQLMRQMGIQAGEKIMLRFACKKGIAGSVVDGCLRDLDGKNVTFLGSYSELYH